MNPSRPFPPYRETLGGKLLAAREAVMAPVRNILREFGVTEQQWRVLRALADRGALDPSSVAAFAILRAPSLTRILRELEDRELIVRAPDPTDGRRAIVNISPRGSEIVYLTLTQTRLWADRYAQAFGAERFQAFSDELSLLTQTILQVTADERMPDPGGSKRAIGKRQKNSASVDSRR